MNFDSGFVLRQLSGKKPRGPASSSADLEAAKAADAILDSLQMPRLAAPVPAAVNVVHSSSSTEGSEKGELDDESVGKSANGEATMTTVSCSD